MSFVMCPFRTSSIGTAMLKYHARSKQEAIGYLTQRNEIPVLGDAGVDTSHDEFLIIVGAALVIIVGCLLHVVVRRLEFGLVIAASSALKVSMSHVGQFALAERQLGADAGLSEVRALKDMLLVTFDTVLTVPIGSEIAANEGTWGHINMSIVARIRVLAVALGEVGAQGNTFVSRLVG